MPSIDSANSRPNSYKRIGEPTMVVDGETEGLREAHLAMKNGMVATCINPDNEYCGKHGSVHVSGDYATFVPCDKLPTIPLANNEYITCYLRLESPESGVTLKQAIQAMAKEGRDMRRHIERMLQGYEYRTDEVVYKMGVM